MIFNKNSMIGLYKITFPLKKGAYAENYRVKDNLGVNYFLKLISYAHLNRSQFNEEGKVLEIEIANKLSHKNITKYHDSGEIIIDNEKFGYVVFDYIAGETTSQHIDRDGGFTVYEAKQIALGVLNGLKFLHSLPIPIIHNEITPQNIMLDLSSTIPIPKIIDFGSARFQEQGSDAYMKDCISPFYAAPETFNGIFSVQTDLFAVGALLYNLIFAQPPYFMNLSKNIFNRNKMIDEILAERHRPLPIIAKDIFEFDDNIENIISKAMAEDIDDRFKTADEFIKALNGEIKVENVQLKRKVKDGGCDLKRVPHSPAKGEGFAAIAGMQELKNILRKEVIDLIKNPEEYAKYGLTLPNGMLLYGPPGCGKTFFAKHFAEEVGFNFMEVKPSTVKSKWVNATQENIGKMFADAVENAPTIIFIDEMNELVPNRDSGDIHEMSRSAVNEMLAQMDRTGEKGVFIIGATNYPNMIDPAILRAGRLDKKYYLGPPDKEARKLMIEMFLKTRPYDFGINYDHLADMTEGYVSADLKMIIDDASRDALVSHAKISEAIIENVINNTSPSVSQKELEKFSLIRTEIELEKSNDSKRPRIGFK
jgi:transitional endoplasmic reticulum ATPase